jgi:NTE family protein
LALSGGTMKSVAHVGVLKALEEAGIEIERITATSGGTIVGSHYAAGIPIRALEERAVSMRLSDLGRVGFRRLGFLSSERLYALVANAIGDMRFEQLTVPLGIVVTNLLTGTVEVIQSGVVAKAAQASCCIPQIYAPVEMNGSLYVDGGLVEYMPTRALKRFDPPLVVGVNLGYHRETSRPSHMLALIMHTMGLVAQQNAAISERVADVVIKPDLRRFGSFETRESRTMVRIGYEETLRRLPDIEREWNRVHTLRGRVNGWWTRLRGDDIPPATAESTQDLVRPAVGTG